MLQHIASFCAMLNLNQYLLGTRLNVYAYFVPDQRKSKKQKIYTWLQLRKTMFKEKRVKL